MRTNNLLVGHMLALGLCVWVTACASPGKTEIHVLAGGFREISHSQTAANKYQVDLQYQDAEGKPIMVWPRSTSTKIINGDTAVFTGNLERRRLFVVRQSGPAVDITDEIIWRWAKATGHNPAIAVKAADLAFTRMKGSQLQLRFEFWTDEKWPDTIVSLDWTTMMDCAREVKEKGSTHALPRSNIIYFEENAVSAHRN